MTSREQEAIEKRGFNTDLAKSAGLAVDRLPQSNAEVAVIEEVLAKELSNLSTNEHEKILFDLHGIDTIPPPISETDKLVELEKQLSLIQDKPAYERAKYLDPTFVQDESFRLMFLRAERFDAKQAAELMVYHFMIKQELFGNGGVLARNVRLSDLSPDDIACVRTGFWQVCPTRDATGRTIFFFVTTLKKYKDMKNLIYAVWYLSMCFLRDEETQKRGVVILMYNYGDRTENLSTIKKVRRVQMGLPMRVAGGHFCYNNPWLKAAILGYRIFLFSDSTRFRMRVHFGDIKDVVPELEKYGIPTENLPIKDGCWSVEWHHEWLKMQEAKEKKESLPVSVNAHDDALPGRFDVLFGKGKARVHTGNLRCFYLVEMNLERYEKAKRHEKTSIADHIISIIHESHGRFLKWEKGAWVEVEHKVAREKVSHFFRRLRSKTNTPSLPTKTATTKTSIATASAEEDATAPTIPP